LTKVARDAIRQRFVGAEMGITGANFLVAETGMVVLVTNDGSDRMTAALPRIHVAIAGIDKVVPAIEDVAVLLKLLARSATGQPITSYTTFIGGPKAPGEEDGPEEFHVVVVDNGRTKLLEDPELREALYCIKCGACANVCPVYQQVGGHTYGWIYSGPIGAVISPVMTGLKEAKALPYASTLCGACGDVCPVKIDLPRLLVHLRTKLADGDARTERSSSWVQRLAMRRWADTVKTRVAMERAPGLSRLLRIPGTQGHRVPLPLGSSQDLPSPSVQSFHQLWHERLSVSEESDRHEPRRITAQAPQVEEAHVSDVAANAEAPAGTERGSGKRGGEQAPLTSRVQESTAKESFLQHVRVALGRQKPLTHAPGHPPLKTTLPRHQEKVRTVHARVEARRAQLIPRLLEGAAQVGWEVHRVNSSIEAARIVGEIARRLRVRRAVRSAQEIFRRVEVDGALRTAGVSLVTLASGRQRRASDIRHLAREADLGIVGADYMVADTASCALIPRKGLARITSQAPPALVVLAEAEQVVESLDDLLALRRLEHLRTRVRTPHIMTLISGPSRTMDIELTMTTGVHGPGQVFLVLIAP
jgi:L-lactate utilization protein LutB